jgi:hypothetical protein
MSQQLPKQHQTSPRSDGNTSLGKRILARIADYYFEWIGLKSMGDDVKEHVKVERQGRFTVL